MSMIAGSSSQRKPRPYFRHGTMTFIVICMFIAVILFAAVILHSQQELLGYGLNNGVDFNRYFIHNTYLSPYNIRFENKDANTDSVGEVDVSKYAPSALDQAEEEVSVTVSTSTTADSQSMVQQLTCPHADLVQYWSSTPSGYDLHYTSDYEAAEGYDYSRQPDRSPVIVCKKYVTFEPDVGGWNNIRMQMELVFVFALSTGRCLVLPPDQPMYLLSAGGKGDGHRTMHSFLDFFPIEYLQRRYPGRIITMATFLQQTARQEAVGDNAQQTDGQDVASNDARQPGMRLGRYPRNLENNYSNFRGLAEEVEIQRLKQQLSRGIALPKLPIPDHDALLATGSNRHSSNHSSSSSSKGRLDDLMRAKAQRLSLYDYLRNISRAPAWQSMTEYLAIPALTADPEVDQAAIIGEEELAFAANRSRQVYDAYWQAQPLIHFISKPGAGYRLLEHWYTFLRFPSPAMDHYYKRLVRDYLHYDAAILCPAAAIIHQLGQEGSYVAFHVRRNEFQYSIMKITAQQMVTNLFKQTKQGSKLTAMAQYLANSNHSQQLYIATDERNKSFFLPLQRHLETLQPATSRLRQPKKRYLAYLDDFLPAIQASNAAISADHLGMIDQVVCSKAAFFVGTWFSTFSGYITRLRGYHGLDDSSVYYADKEHRDRFQPGYSQQPKFPYYMREWPTAWKNIDEENDKRNEE